MPHNLTTQNLINGKCEIPQQVEDFYFTLMVGSGRRRKSADCRRKVNSFAQDLIHVVTNSKIKTSKHNFRHVFEKLDEQP